MNHNYVWLCSVLSRFDFVYFLDLNVTWYCIFIIRYKNLLRSMKTNQSKFYNFMFMFIFHVV